MTLWGVDVSNHQAGASLAKAKAAGCSFVFAKATEGLTYKDSEFATFRAQAKSASMPFGAYHFARPQAGRTGTQEAAHFLDVYTYAAGDLPPVLDLETTSLTASQTVTFALQWLAVVEKATGRKPYLYTYSAFAGQHLGGGTALAAYPLWLASYRSTEPPAPAPWSSWAIWQHTSSATVPGISGNVDRNITHLPLASLEDPMAFTADEETLLVTAAKRTLAAGTASPRLLNDKDGATIRGDVAATNARLDALDAKVDALAAPAPVTIDYDLLAQKVVEKLTTGQTPLTALILGKA